MAELKHKDTWSGRYRHVSFEIALHGVGDSYRPEGTWCYYLYLKAQQLPDDRLKEFDVPLKEIELVPRHRKMYDYDAIPDLNWHCGITYYKKHGGDGRDEPLVFQMGCDFAHYWDEGDEYTLEMVTAEAKATIDKLWEIVPNLKVWCQNNGNYYDLSEGIEGEGGSFRSNESLKEHDNGN